MYKPNGTALGEAWSRALGPTEPGPGGTCAGYTVSLSLSLSLYIYTCIWRERYRDIDVGIHINKYINKYIYIYIYTCAVNARHPFSLNQIIFYNGKLKLINIYL